MIARAVHGRECGAESPEVVPGAGGFLCTRPKGHPPDVHVAHVDDREVHRWPVNEAVGMSAAGDDVIPPGRAHGGFEAEARARVGAPPERPLLSPAEELRRSADLLDTAAQACNAAARLVEAQEELDAVRRHPSSGVVFEGTVDAGDVEQPIRSVSVEWPSVVDDTDRQLEELGWEAIVKALRSDRLDEVAAVAWVAATVLERAEAEVDRLKGEVLDLREKVEPSCPSCGAIGTALVGDRCLSCGGEVPR